MSNRKPRRKVGEFREQHGLDLRGYVVPGTKVYRLDDLAVFVSPEPTGLHLSISAPGRYPDWDEIAAARYQLLPDDKTFVMVLPPPDEYVNVDDTGNGRGGNVFHLHEARVAGDGVFEIGP